MTAAEWRRVASANVSCIHTMLAWLRASNSGTLGSVSQRLLHILDDVLATGGTARAKVELVEELGGVVAGVLFVIELEFLQGRARLSGYDVHSLIQY